jgi:LPXTG-motif cell wall-anchored protein
MTGGRLPVTGAPLGWLIAAALALIGIGVALRAVRRRELPVPGN